MRSAFSCVGAGLDGRAGRTLGLEGFDPGRDAVAFAASPQVPARAEPAGPRALGIRCRRGRARCSATASSGSAPRRASVDSRLPFQATRMRVPHAGARAWPRAGSAPGSGNRTRCARWCRSRAAHRAARRRGPGPAGRSRPPCGRARWRRRLARHASGRAGPRLAQAVPGRRPGALGGGDTAGAACPSAAAWPRARRRPRAPAARPARRPGRRPRRRARSMATRKRGVRGVLVTDADQQLRARHVRVLPPDCRDSSPKAACFQNPRAAGGMLPPRSCWLARMGSSRRPSRRVNMRTWMIPTLLAAGLVLGVPCSRRTPRSCRASCSTTCPAGRSSTRRPRARAP